MSRMEKRRSRASPSLTVTGVTRATDGETMSKVPAPSQHAADSHDLIRVHGARENNLKDVSVELPKRRLTVFTASPAPARAPWCSTRSPPSRSG